MILAAFRVNGRPRTKGSLKAICTKGPQHKIRYTEEVKDSGRWRRMVALEAQRDMKARHGKLLAHAGPVEVRMVAYFDRELSTAAGCAPGTAIPSHRTDFPTDVHLGDVDKLARNVGDALTDSHLIRDDSQITDFLVAKRWATADCPAGVEVIVQEMERPDVPVWIRAFRLLYRAIRRG